MSQKTLFFISFFILGAILFSHFILAKSSSVISSSQDSIPKIVQEKLSSYSFPVQNNLKLNNPNQTTQGIISITKAIQLSQNQTSFKDITDKVSIKDNQWAGIDPNQYIRFTFQKPLASNNDIRLYAKTSTDSALNSTATIQIYPVYTNAQGIQSEGPKIAEIIGIKATSNTYSFLLSNLAKTTDTFDLKVTKVKILIDYIVDPSFELLHSFNSSNPADGATPDASLILSGSTLYGTTANGGANNAGTIFSVNTNGSGFTLLHSFTSSDPTDGTNPQASLILSGSTLYGTTANGGANNVGTVFSINTNGSGFTLLHSFNSSDGANPDVSLILLGSTLYGTTFNGGANNAGTIFSVNTNGSGFTLLHNFNSSDPSDGANPYAPLILSGSTFYGTTETGGANNVGTIFSINTNGSGFTLLHSFNSSDPADGTYSDAPLTLSNSTLYGTALLGGANNDGIIFSINTNGSGFTLLHSFNSSDPADGVNPYASLILSGSNLYGIALGGGANNVGTVFSINTNGSGFALIHSFDPSDPADGAYPYAPLILSGSTFYGTTESGGANNAGTIFSIILTPTFISILNTTGYIKAGDFVSFTTIASDPYSSNTIILYVCKANDFTGSACGGGGQWCSSSFATTNPSCSYTITSGDGDGSQNYYANIIDDNNAGSLSNPILHTFNTDVTVPTTTDDYGVKNGNLQNATQTITLTPADAASGVASTKYCIDIDNTCDPTIGTTYTSPVSINTEGTSYFRYESTDNVGNVQTTVSRQIRINTVSSTPDSISGRGGSNIPISILNIISNQARQNANSPQGQVTQSGEVVTNVSAIADQIQSIKQQLIFLITQLIIQLQAKLAEMLRQGS